MSLAIKHLSLMGMLDNETVQNLGKGRPHNSYNLKKPIKEYFSAIKKQKENEWLMVKLALDDIGQQFAN